MKIEKQFFAFIIMVTFLLGVFVGVVAMRRLEVDHMEALMKEAQMKGRP